MKSLRLLISEAAQTDLADTWDFIAQDSIRSADRYLDRLYRKCRLLAQSPEIGRRREDLGAGLRSHPVDRYLIFYRVGEDSLEIVRILSGYRDIDSLF